MKIPYRHLVQHIEESPSIEHISNKLFQLGRKFLSNILYSLFSIA